MEKARTYKNGPSSRIQDFTFSVSCRTYIYLDLFYVNSLTLLHGPCNSSSWTSQRKGVISNVLQLNKGIKFSDLECAEHSADVIKSAQHLLSKIQDFNKDFKQIYYKILDCIEENDEEALEREQEHFSIFDDQVDRSFI